MIGIPGLDPFGLVHALFGIASVVLGLGVVLLHKGTTLHRRVGVLYAASMLLLNLTALAIYDMFGGFGPFHALALVSLASIVAGVLPVWLRRPTRGWMEFHAHFMSWSYMGVVAALITEVLSRLPGVNFAVAVILPMVVVGVVSAVLIHTRVPRILSRYAHLSVR